MDDVTREFEEFALSSKEIDQYPDEPENFENAWFHEHEKEKKRWRDAILKEIQDMENTFIFSMS